MDPDSGALVALAMSGDVPPGLAPGLIVPPGIGLTGLAVQQARLLISPDVLTDPRVSFTSELTSRSRRKRSWNGCATCWRRRGSVLPRPPAA